MQIYVDKTKLLTGDDIPTSPYNLFNGTADYSGTTWVNLEQYTNDKWNSPYGNQSRQRKGNWLGLSQDKYLYANQLYTISASVFVDKTTSSGFIGAYGDGNNGVISGNTTKILDFKNAPNNWITIKYTFTVPKNGNYKVRFESSNDQVNIHWADLMLNKGAVALDWNYSLNDLRTKLGGGKA